jgi:transposase
VQVVHPRCCGLDVHKKLVVGCFMATDSSGQLTKQIRSFGATVKELLELGDWLVSLECNIVVMESTGSYWKPVYNLLEGQFELLVVNAQHIKAVPGRKTDVKDAEWLAQLLRHGLLKASFIPSTPQRHLRDLTRYRTSLVQERAREVNRLQKILEDSNFKLASVVTDIMGVSARAILAQLVAGETDSVVLANLARGRLREKREALAQALSGELAAHHRFMLTELLRHIDFLQETIERLSQEVAERLGPFEDAVVHLDSIPGVNRRIAEIILAEIGHDMSRFADGRHLASWLGLCPGNKASGGKRLSGKTRKGNQAARQALIEAGQAACHTKHTFLGELGRRIGGRRGKKVGVVAVAHRIVLIIYQLLSKGEDYQELGAIYSQAEQKAAERAEQRWIAKLQRRGYEVKLKPAG